MEKISKSQNILFQYFQWHFFDSAKNVLIAWRNFIFFNLNYFSIPLLLKTLFSPWRRYRWAYPRGFSFGKYFEVFVSNLFSRIMGAIIRVVLIVFGLLVEIFIIFGGAIVFLVWILLPFLLIYGIFYGFKILF